MEQCKCDRLSEITYLYRANAHKRNKNSRVILIQLFSSMQPDLNPTKGTFMVQVLKKMAQFFNDMATLCQQHSSTLPRTPPTQTLLSQALVEPVRQPLDPEREEVSPERAPARQGRPPSSKRTQSHKPKHPLSSFFIFYKERGQQIAKEKGEVVGSKVAKIVAALWNTMSTAEKQPYQIRSREARELYEQQMSHYRSHYTQEIAQLKEHKKQARIKKNNKPIKTNRVSVQSDIVVQPPQYSGQENNQSSSESSQGMPESGPSLSQGSQDISDGLEDALSDSQEHFPPELSAVKLQEELSPTKPVYLDPQRIQELIQKLHKLPNEVKSEPKDTSKSIKQQKSHSEASEKSAVSRPKGPVSSFLIFYRMKGRELSIEKGIAPGPKLVKMASQLWNSMNPEDKAVYEAEAKESRDKYYQQMSKLRMEFGEEGLAKRVVNKGKDKSQKRKYKKKD